MILFLRHLRTDCLKISNYPHIFMPLYASDSDCVLFLEVLVYSLFFSTWQAVVLAVQYCSSSNSISYAGLMNVFRYPFARAAKGLLQRHFFSVTQGNYGTNETTNV